MAMGVWDNTAVDGLRVQCQGPGMSGSIVEELTEFIDKGDWGGWSSGCPLGTAVCSIKTRVEPDLGANWAGVDYDSVSLTDAQMHCCDY